MSRTKTSGGASRKVLAGKAPRKILGSTSKTTKAKTSKSSKFSKSSKSSKGKNVYRGGNRIPKNMKTPGWQKGIKEFLSAVNQDGAGSSSDIQECGSQDVEIIVEKHNEVGEVTSNGHTTDSSADQLDNTGTNDRRSEEMISDKEIEEADSVDNVSKNTTSNMNHVGRMEVSSGEEVSVDRTTDSIEDMVVGSAAENKEDDCASEGKVEESASEGKVEESASVGKVEEFASEGKVEEPAAEGNTLQTEAEDKVVESAVEDKMAVSADDKMEGPVESNKV